MTLRVKGPGKVLLLSRRIYEKNVPLRIPTPSPTASLPPEVKFLNEIGKVQIRGQKSHFESIGIVAKGLSLDFLL
jgi:hypothetical protein